MIYSAISHIHFSMNIQTSDNTMLLKQFWPIFVAWQLWENDYLFQSLFTDIWKGIHCLKVALDFFRQWKQIVGFF